MYIDKLAIGRIVDIHLRNIIENEIVSEIEIEKFLTKEYSKQIFNLNFPLLSKEMLKSNNVQRTYRTPVKRFNGKEYYLTSQWYDTSRYLVYEWLAKHNFNF